MTDSYDHLKAQKDRIERTQAEIMAARIVDALFTNGSGEMADRLVLRQVLRSEFAANPDYVRREPYRELGGWNREAATAQVIEVLLGERR